MKKMMGFILICLVALNVSIDGVRNRGIKKIESLSEADRDWLKQAVRYSRRNSSLMRGINKTSNCIALASGVAGAACFALIARKVFSEDSQYRMAKVLGMTAVGAGICGILAKFIASQLVQREKREDLEFSESDFIRRWAKSDFGRYTIVDRNRKEELSLEEAQAWLHDRNSQELRAQIGLSAIYNCSEVNAFIRLARKMEERKRIYEEREQAAELRADRRL